ncbi:SIR2 family protein [Listeria seeligeri]|uniref:SIR2 family protein n=1 Tax=Listeria seeligeri TaxID=1640 RepID=UPI001888BDBC|nr:SIR2 family protein [Listeria seeligeri]MBF2641718.1 SIR2 family protein [Listeria seeligeri]
MANEYSNFLDEINGKNINFLIGSGASAGIIPTLWIDAFSKSFEELLTSKEYNDKQKIVLYYLWFNLWVKKTQILEIKDQSKEIVENYERFISNLITLSNHEGFDKPKRVNIFTTNYDTLFELSFDKLASQNRLTFFNDGSRGFLKKYVSSENFYITAAHSGISDGFQRSIPTINLIKLHGSVTWKKDNEKIEMSLENKIFEDLVKEAEEVNELILSSKEDVAPIRGDSDLNAAIDFFDIENIEQPIFDNTLTEDTLKEHINQIYSIAEDKLKCFKERYDLLPIVSPTKQKFSETVFEQHYYQMLRMLSFELEKKDSVLIVFGFSFADEHILEIARRSMVNPFLKIYVIAYNKKSKETIEKALGKGTQIEFIPNFEEKVDGSLINGNFTFLNNLLGGKK